MRLSFLITNDIIGWIKKFIICKLRIRKVEEKKKIIHIIKNLLLSYYLLFFKKKKVILLVNKLEIL
jgi:hypothetical protein